MPSCLRFKYLFKSSHAPKKFFELTFKIGSLLLNALLTISHSGAAIFLVLNFYFLYRWHNSADNVSLDVLKYTIRYQGFFHNRLQNLKSFRRINGAYNLFFEGVSMLFCFLLRQLHHSRKASEDNAGEGAKGYANAAPKSNGAAKIVQGEIKMQCLLSDTTKQCLWSGKQAEFLWPTQSASGQFCHDNPQPKTIHDCENIYTSQ